MPRYFFYVEGSPPDSEGVDLENIEVAKCEAVKFAGQLICDSAIAFWDSRDFVLSVTDEGGLVLFNLMFVGTEAASIAVPRVPPTVDAARPS